MAENQQQQQSKTTPEEEELLVSYEEEEAVKQAKSIATEPKPEAKFAETKSEPEFIQNVPLHAFVYKKIDCRRGKARFKSTRRYEAKYRE